VCYENCVKIALQESCSPWCVSHLARGWYLTFEWYCTNGTAWKMFNLKQSYHYKFLQYVYLTPYAKGDCTCLNTILSYKLRWRQSPFKIRSCLFHPLFCCNTSLSALLTWVKLEVAMVCLFTPQCIAKPLVCHFCCCRFMWIRAWMMDRKSRLEGREIRRYEKPVVEW